MELDEELDDWLEMGVLELDDWLEMGVLELSAEAFEPLKLRGLNFV
jgi:hypothetical protein